MLLDGGSHHTWNPALECYSRWFMEIYRPELISVRYESPDVGRNRVP
jgi:hypothetical protein